MLPRRELRQVYFEDAYEIMSSMVYHIEMDIVNGEKEEKETADNILFATFCTIISIGNHCWHSN